MVNSANIIHYDEIYDNSSISSDNGCLNTT